MEVCDHIRQRSAMLIQLKDIHQQVQVGEEPVVAEEAFEDTEVSIEVEDLTMFIVTRALS